MKTRGLFNRIGFLVLTVSSNLFAQNALEPPVYLRTETLRPQKNIIEWSFGKSQSKVLNQKVLSIIQFERIPNSDLVEKLKNAGIRLLDYIPDNAYIATYSGVLNTKVLEEVGARSIIEVRPNWKLDPKLLPEHLASMKSRLSGEIDVRINFARTFSFDQILLDLQSLGLAPLNISLKDYDVFDLRIKKEDIPQLVNFSWVQYIESVPDAPTPLNDRSVANAKANLLNNSNILGYTLKGEGVVIGLGDYSSLNSHMDLKPSMISDNTLGTTAHGLHVAGTLAGSGLINEKFKGFAPKSSMIARQTTTIIEDAAQLYANYGMVLTNNSYATSTTNVCSLFGLYDAQSVIVDKQMAQLPSLQHVIAAGNSGQTMVCEGMPLGFGSIIGSYNVGKNVITVGQTLVDGDVAASSSKGPTKDGRIKPDIVAQGTSVTSTSTSNTYQALSGTSMSTPAVTGGLALLYQRYRQLHQNNNPKNALMKALICNGATDRGLPGPDFSYGFGQMNLLRSVTMLDKGNYKSGSIAHQSKDTHFINVPANTAQLKMMLYWNDATPSMLAGGKSLVNDLDIKLVTPAGTQLLPIFPTKGDVNAAATPGIDTLNNIEQIVVDSPAAGTYSILVSGSKVPSGPQEYFVVYDVIERNSIITYPTKAEKLSKGDEVNIQWESNGETAGSYSVSYSLNNGASWVPISNNVSSSSRLLSWTVPDATTNIAKIRIQQNGTTMESEPFTITGVPAPELSIIQCKSYVSLEWPAVSGASGYEVMISNGGEMKSVGITTELKYVLSALSTDSTYYVSVRVKNNDIVGRRSAAVIRKPDNGSCIGAISDNDLKIGSIIAPHSTVRKFNGVTYTNSEVIGIVIENLDDTFYTKPFKIGYSIGVGYQPITWETVNTFIPPFGTLNYSFTKRADLSQEGDYPLTVWVKAEGDKVAGNDSLSTTLRFLSNSKIKLPFSQTFSSQTSREIKGTRIGVSGAIAYDFYTGNGNSRLRTNVSDGSTNPNRLVLDVWPNTTASQNSTLVGTYNLSDYKGKNFDIQLAFRYIKPFKYNYVSDAYVQIRGSSKDPWISAGNLTLSGSTGTSDRSQVATIDIGSLLKTNGQDFSEDFQVAWTCNAFGDFPSDGFALNDIQIFYTEHDIEVVSITAPPISTCEANTSPTIFVRNNGSTACKDLMVAMSLDGAVTHKVISLLPAGASTTINFEIPVSGYTIGQHTIIANINKDGNTQTQNSAKTFDYTVRAPIASFPYFEDFERGVQGWSSTGTNSSWQFGTPNANNIQTSASGLNAWKTNLTGNYNNNELSYLTSPCFNFTLGQKAALSFRAWIDLEQCSGDQCDQFYIEINTGNGWQRLGQLGSGTNWYNSQVSGGGAWQGKFSPSWQVFTYALPISQSLQIRFVFKSNGSGTTDGIVLDDIHIYNQNYHIYEGETISTGVQPLNIMGESVSSFFTINDQIFASIDPGTQNIGSLRLKTFKNPGPIRSIHNQWVLNRSFVVEAVNALENAVPVRFYISEAEIDQMVLAADHTKMTKSSILNKLTISKYSGTQQDGDFTNNSSTGWEYFTNENVKIKPYGNGYILELETQSFSEFFIGTGKIEIASSLPVKLLSFTATKSELSEKSSVLLKWVTASETNFERFELEAADANNVRKGDFALIASISGSGGETLKQSYSFLDKVKQSIIYYRLKMIDVDGTYQYSKIISTDIGVAPQEYVYPNPSSGIFNVSVSATDFKMVSVFDLSGKLVNEYKARSNGNTNEVEIDLSSPLLPSGGYIIELESSRQRKRFKVFKN